MVLWILLVIAILLAGMRVREHYVEISGPGARPSKTADWLSKIDAEAPIGGNDDDYLRALQSFYDTIYLPARTANPTVFIRDTEVKKFADSVTIPSIDKGALRKIITAGFAVERTGSAAAREQEQIVTTGALADFKGLNLQPKDGVDETWPHAVQDPYVPADLRKGALPEGIYTPTKQQEEPRREGIYDDKSTSWTDVKFQSVCDGGECAKNVL
jgi:hypothetical protein